MLQKAVEVKFQVVGVGDEAELSEPLSLSLLHCPPSRHQPQQASEAHMPRQWAIGSIRWDWTGNIIWGGNVNQGLAESEVSCAAPAPYSEST